jgi:hypothetical protein
MLQWKRKALGSSVHQTARTVNGRPLIALRGARDQPPELLARGEFGDEVGRENILPNVQAALDRARKISASFNGVGPEIAHDLLRMKI